MDEEIEEHIRQTVLAFRMVHAADPRMAYSMAISIFVTCYAILSLENRIKCSLGLMALMNEISDTVFEDGQDFVAFLKDKAVEQGLSDD